MKPRGPWQEEFLRELRESGEEVTFQTVVDATNSYDDQLEHRIGEGRCAEGRKHLKALIRAGNALSKRLASA